ncbi:hypothetical protein VTK26DRAFT_953 [Humicola hyalothermophila]
MDVPEEFSELSTKALRVIRASKLPHPKGALLESFITEAADRDRAAQYLLERVLGGSSSRKSSSSTGDIAARLDALCSDWGKLVATFVDDGPVRPLRDRRYVPVITQRDGGICRFSGLGDSWHDRLAVYPILPPFGRSKIDIDPSLHGLLAVFLGQALSEWVILGCEDPCRPFGSHWLLRSSAAAAFAQGFWRLHTFPTTRWEVTTCRKYTIWPTGIGGLTEPDIVRKIELGRSLRLFDESGRDIDLPDERALELAARFSTPVRWAHVSRAIERRRARPYVVSACRAVCAVTWRLLSVVWRPVSRRVWFLWRLLPDQVRIRAYYALYRAGRFIYGPTDTKVQRLPFNLFIKHCSRRSNGPLINEYDALRLIRRHSDLPVPRPLDLVSDSKRTYMVTSRIPGHKMGAVLNLLTDEQVHNLATDLNAFLARLRAIPKQLRPATVPTTAVTGVGGGGCHHVRMELIFGDRAPHGPFATEEEFHSFILTRRPPAPDEIQLAGHDIVLTHGDLSRRNIIVDEDGKLAGIVDWEHAGWYPTYWEFTSFMYGLDSVHVPQRFVDMADDIFRGFGDFSQELAIERRLWMRIF